MFLKHCAVKIEQNTNPQTNLDNFRLHYRQSIMIVKNQGSIPQINKQEAVWFLPYLEVSARRIGGIRGG